MSTRKLLLTLSLIATLAGAHAAPAQTLSRIDRDFVQWTRDTIDGNHPEGSDGYVDLDGDDAADFRSAVEAFLAEDWANADLLADDVGYEVVVFRDSGNGDEAYYGLLPQAGNGDGRGFYFVRPRAHVRRRLVVQAPHAVEDERTGVLGSEIFRASGARALMLTGADRCASDAFSTCTGSTDCGAHRISDGAHAVDTFFHIFHEEASREHGDTHVLQLHGFKADGTDPEFSVSDGTQTNAVNDPNDTYLPNALYKDLQGRMQLANPALTRNGSSCNKAGHGDFQCGTQSVQGRDANGSGDACSTNATTASGRFIHLELSNDLRDPFDAGDPADFYSQQLVIDAVNTVFPAKAVAGDRIWADVNGNGVQDAGEPGVHGVTVEVLDANDAVVESTTSIVGAYRIGNLDPGTYRLRVQVPAGYTAGTGFGPDGRANTPFVVTAGQTLLTVDAPLIPPTLALIGDRVWNDADRDGLQDTGESGLGSVAVRLLTADDATVATGTTNSLGSYSFSALPGEYKVRVTPGARGFTRQVAGAPNDDSDIDPLTGASAAFSVTSGATDVSRDAGLATCFDIPLVPRNARWLWKSGGMPWPADWKDASPASLAGWTGGYAPFGFGGDLGDEYETEIPSLFETGIFTTYFRHSFEVVDPALFQEPLQLTFERDDGVVIYVNGTEVVRRNLPWGAATRPDMPASTEASTTETITIPPSLLVAGTNVVAVELHEVTPDEDEEEEDIERLFGLTITGRSCDCRLAEVSLRTSDTTYLEEDDDTSNNGSNSTAGVAGDSDDEEVALLRWQTTGLPADAEVVHAEIVLNMTSVSNARGVRFPVWPVLRPWTESQTTWLSAGPTAWQVSGAKGGTDRDTSNPVGLMTLRTTGKGAIPLASGAWGLIESWADGGTNHGFVIGEDGPNGEVNFSSDETGTTTNRPTLRVIYRKPACQ